MIVNLFSQESVFDICMLSLGLGLPSIYSCPADHVPD